MDNISKIPPQYISGESMVLGAILLEKEAIDIAVSALKTEDFYDPLNRMVYKACLSLYASNRPIDMLTVVAECRKLKLNVKASYVAELTVSVNSSSNMEQWVKVIQEMSMRREVITKTSKINNDAYNESIDIFEIIDSVDSEVQAIASSRVRGDFKPISDTLTDTVVEMYETKDEDITGVPMGFKELDEMTGGLHGDELIIIAARPGMGKTAFVISTALNMVKSNMPVGIFSLEMGVNQLNKRIISSETNIDLNKIIKSKYIKDWEWDKIHDFTTKLNDYPIYIDDTASLSIIELKTKAKKMKKEHNVSVIIVDYLQLMTGDKVGNREQEISSISRALKALSKELHVPVIALSQLSRAVETRGGDKKPMLSHLRESGSIEQDADMVMFLYRPEYYGQECTEDGESLVGKGMVIVAKNRHGALDEVYLDFTGRLTKWHDSKE